MDNMFNNYERDRFDLDVELARAQFEYDREQASFVGFVPLEDN